MPPFCETLVLLPCGSLEDFPSRLAQDDARGVLAALTGAWHPRLIAAGGAMPRWQRADSPLPEVAAAAGGDAAGGAGAGGDEVAAGAGGGSDYCGGDDTTGPPGRLGSAVRQLILLPAVSEAKLEPSAARQLPSGTAAAIDLVDGRAWVRVQTRGDVTVAIDELFGGPAGGNANSDLSLGCLAVDDFYALGYLYWQVSVMTRRLRYTSNLDTERLDADVAAAAAALLEGQPSAATESLHRCFDALAEERDHYFASDPSLIDLTLTTPALLPRWLDQSESLAAATTSAAATSTATSAAAPNEFLAVPGNVLLDDEVARSVLDDPAMHRRLTQTMSWSWPVDGDANRTQTLQADANSPGWAGGGPAAEVRLDTLSIDAAERVLGEAMRRGSGLGGGPVGVWGRRGGGLPADLVAPLAAAGVIGILPHDFASGRELASGETKVVLGGPDAVGGSAVGRSGRGASGRGGGQGGGHGREAEAIVATPIDAQDDASFLTLGTRLGQLSDSGEIATALFVRWPGGGCDSFADLRRAARWSVALGRFWNLQAYFRDGETPYHHANLPVATGAVDDLAAPGHDGTDGTDATLPPGAIGELIAPGGRGGIGQRFAAAISGTPVETSAADAMAVLNPSALPRRHRVWLPPAIITASASRPEIYRRLGGGEVLVDVPAWGHVLLGGPGVAFESRPAKKMAGGISGRLIRWWKGRRRTGSPDTGGWRDVGRGDPVPLRNEFMDLAVDIVRGGLRGVYAGSVRGNRLSGRLVWPAAGPATAAIAQARQYRVESSGGSGGRVSLRGRWAIDPGSPPQPAATSLDPATLPDWEMTLEMPPGQRFFTVETAVQAVAATPGPFWQRRPCWRLALAEGAPAVRVLLRGQWHRVAQRSFVAGGGVMLEESDRKTLIAASNPLAVRRVGERFVDVAIDPAGLGQTAALTIGIEVPRPAALIASLNQPVVVAPLQLPPGAEWPGAGWWMHVSRPGIVSEIVDAAVVQSEEHGEALAVQVRLIAPARGHESVTLRFCRPILAAERIAPLDRPLGGRPLAGRPPGEGPVKLAIRELGSPIDCDEEKMTLAIGRHEVVHVVALLGIEPPPPPPPEPGEDR